MTTNNPSVETAEFVNGESSSKPLLSDKVYDTMKWCTQYALPAVGTLYFAIAQIWGLPNAEQIVGTITALVAFFGVLLGVSNSQYKNSYLGVDGVLQIDSVDPQTDLYSFEPRTPLPDLPNKDVITLKVVQTPR